MENLKNDFRKGFYKMKDEELVAAFNEKVKTGGWNTVKHLWSEALFEEMTDRGWDISVIQASEEGASWTNKVSLVGDRLVLEESLDESLNRYYVEILHPTEDKVLWHYYISAKTSKEATDECSQRFREDQKDDILLDTGGLFLITAEEEPEKGF
jgi:hypothetical protein